MSKSQPGEEWPSSKSISMCKVKKQQDSIKVVLSGRLSSLAKGQGTLQGWCVVKGGARKVGRSQICLTQESEAAEGHMSCIEEELTAQCGGWDLAQRLLLLDQQQPWQPTEPPSRLSNKSANFRPKCSIPSNFQNSVKIIREASIFSKKHFCPMMTTSRALTLSGEAVLISPTSVPLWQMGPG